ncbi:MAG: exo-alpha-sialidase [Paludibacter sp.]
MKHFLLIAIFLLSLSNAFAVAPFTTQANLFNQTNAINLGLSKATGTETFSVFKPSATTNHFSNGVVLAAFKNTLYCMWQSSASDEDATDTWVAYSKSTNGTDWSAPVVLANNAPKGIYTSGGWFVRNDSLIAYINTWPGLNPKGGYTQYKSTADGTNWSGLKVVRMLSGDTLKAIFEQDPHVLSSGRIINAAHFQPGLNAAPIYSDDPSGVKGWVRATYTNLSTGSSSQEMEPSSFAQSDGTLVMIFRDQNSSYTKLASSSTDNGRTWSATVQTDMPDSRSKQCAGNLPDGTAFFVSNPVSSKTRIPLVLTLSSTGKVFTKAYVMREGGSGLQAQRYTGTSKTLGYSYPKTCIWNNYLYASYSTNKEDVEITRIPLSSVSLNSLSGIAESESTETRLSIYSDKNGFTRFTLDNDNKNANLFIYNLQGQLVSQVLLEKGRSEIRLPKGVYVVG